MPYFISVRSGNMAFVESPVFAEHSYHEVYSNHLTIFRTFPLILPFPRNPIISRSMWSVDISSIVLMTHHLSTILRNIRYETFAKFIRFKTFTKSLPLLVTLYSYNKVVIMLIASPRACTPPPLGH